MTPFCCAALRLSGGSVMGTWSVLPKVWAQAQSYSSLAVTLNNVVNGELMINHF